MHVARLALRSRLPGYEFVAPDHVREEITDANQRMALDDAVERAREVARNQPLSQVVTQ